MESDQNLPGVIEKIVNQLPNEIRDPQEQEKIVDLLVNFLMSQLTNLSGKEIQKMFEPMLSDIKKSRAYQEIAQEVALEVTKKVTQDVTQQVAYQSKREIALAMLKKNMTPALISELTGLSKQQVSELRKELVNGSKQSKLRRSGK